MSQPVSEEYVEVSGTTGRAEHPRASFGSWLRHQREARSVSLREIADNSKISLRYLEALEQDRFDVLPAPVFARGFLREYARVVGLNPDEVVNLYLVALEERAEGSRRVERPKTARSERPRSAPSSLGYGLLLGLAVVLFVGVAALLSFLAERRRATPLDSRLVAPATMVARAQVPAAPASGARIGAAAGRSAGRRAAGSGQLAGGRGRAAGVRARRRPLPVTPERASRRAAGAAAGPFRVVLNFSQDCWMESVVDGNRRTSELKAAGETVQLEAFEFVVLTLGNSRAVTVEVEGVPFALPENSTRVVRDLRIERPAGAPEPRGSSVDRASPLPPVHLLQPSAGTIADARGVDPPAGRAGPVRCRAESCSCSPRRGSCRFRRRI